VQKARRRITGIGTPSTSRRTERMKASFVVAKMTPAFRARD